jgi:branched-chain amino acid transport system permease protein
VLTIIAQVSPPTLLDVLFTKVIDGLALGSIYALLALGFVIIFKSTQVLTFAHGAVAAVGAYLVAYFVTVINWPGRYLESLPATLRWSISALVAVVAAAGVGMLIERIFIRPMIGEPIFSVAMITIGVEIVLRTTVGDLLGQGGNLSIGSPWGLLSITNLSGIVIPHVFVAAIVTMLIVVAGLGVFFRSRTGIAMRATAFDQEAAMAQGVSAGRIFAIAWGLGAALAALGGIYASIAPRAIGVTGGTAFVAFRAFPAIIIGGLDSVVGAVLGGLIIGLAEILTGHYLAQYSGALGAGFNGIVPYLLMMGFLLIRPYGMFGTEEIRRV